NDIYGHNEGDALLVNIAGMLRRCAPVARAVRMGGDEFVLIFPEDISREELCEIAGEIIECVQRKEGSEHILTNISMSIGILYDEKVEQTLEDTLLKSDMAMYHAKDSGKGRYVIFNDIADIVLGELEMEKRQKQALDNREFEVRYTPIVMAQTPRLYMAQAYVVWNMPDGRCKQQEDFFPLFLKNGFSAELNAWVIGRVLQDIAASRGKKGCPDKIGVQISRLQLLNGNLLPWLEKQLHDYRVKAEEIEFEIDESAFTRGKEEMFANIEALHKSGFRISITGVGLDFASLRYWDSLPIDTLKFQKEYLHQALKNLKGRRIMKTLMAVGREMKMDIVAEGVTSHENIMYLIECGCNAMGGEYFSRPLCMEDFLRYVKEKLRTEMRKDEFPFWSDYAAVDGTKCAVPLGRGVHLTEGINTSWGGVLLDGGGVKENVLELPPELLASDSYTIC
ncbi:MAG: EAL domain-containing protein, partial [Acetatifactor sp.]|nr:EAL domain-containing protein [Acetatifactor sp.]